MTDPISSDSLGTPLAPPRAELTLPSPRWVRSFDRPRRIAELFRLADVIIGGSRPWDIRVHRDRFYRRMLAGGSLALGESYMDGDWDCEALDQFFDRVISNRLGATLGLTLPLPLPIMLSPPQNPPTVTRPNQAAHL